MRQVNSFEEFNQEAFDHRKLTDAKSYVENMIKFNPSRKELAMFLCAMAEHSMFNIDETPEWQAVNEYELFTVEEFEVDLTEVEKANAIGEMGQARWKYIGS